MARYNCPIELSVLQKDGTSKIVTVDSSDLVPGDIIKVPENLVLPCDLVLMTGSAIVNEAILTGESIPVMKQSLPEHGNDIYIQSECTKHSLYGGTSVLQTRQTGDELVIGVVTNTGFMTTKGSLVRDILFPKPIIFTFLQDAYKFIAIMAIVALLGFCIEIPLMYKIHVAVDTYIDRSLELIVIAVPPALPAAMAVGVGFALERLKTQGIFCISPPRVNLAGMISSFVFDKTGTLTEEGLSVLGYRIPSGEKQKCIYSEHQSTLKSEDKWWQKENADSIHKQTSSLYVEALASCTAITYVKGTLIGDPLDVKMFEATGWFIDEPHTQVDKNRTEDEAMVI